MTDWIGFVLGFLSGILAAAIFFGNRIARLEKQNRLAEKGKRR